MDNKEAFFNLYNDFATNHNMLWLKPGSAEKMYLYLDGFLSENKKFNLTSVTDFSEAVSRHVLDSLCLVSTINELARSDGRFSVADVGTGGGFPSSVLASSFPSAKVIAIDSTEKKLEFVSRNANECGIFNLETLYGRAEEIGRTNKRESFDFVTARAVAKLSVLLELAIPLVKHNGYFVALKGNSFEDELRETGDAANKLGASFVSCVPYSITPGHPCGVIAVYKKTAKTASVYPRRFGNIKKDPLK